MSEPSQPQKPVKCWPWLVGELIVTVAAIVALMHFSAGFPSWDDHVRGLLASLVQFGISTASTLLARYTKLSTWPMKVVEALVTLLTMVFLMRYMASHPSLDDTLRGLGAALIGYVISLITTAKLGR